MTLLERIENIEQIIIHKFGTLDIDVIQMEDEAFFKEANERLAKINEGLDENNVLLEEFNEARDKRIASRKDLEKLKDSLKVGSKEDTTASSPSS